MVELVYILPVHNEAQFLAANVERAATRLRAAVSAEVYLVENGSRDRSWEIAQELAWTVAEVRAFREPAAGIGYAYHRGLREAVAAFGPSTTRWAVLTAADLPFGFSDLDAALPVLETRRSRICMGSKAHRDSRAPTSAKRRAMSAVYAFARRVVLGMRVRDSQGSVFLRLDLAADLLPRIVSRGFFYSTELCFYAERAGETIVELPVVLEESRRASTVKPLRDGLRMARQLIELRARERSAH